MPKLRIERQIRAAVKKLKRGEIPLPPAPAVASPEDSQRFVEELKDRRRKLQAEQRRLASDSSRRGHKKRLRIDEELVRLDEMLGVE
jgi:hypothetical protein